MFMRLMFIFFSSRRRHTRFDCDWSSDVCSSDYHLPLRNTFTPVHQSGWPDWPKWLESWEPAVVNVLRSGKWYRGDGGHVAEFEAGYAKMLGAKRCQELKGKRQGCATTVAMTPKLLLADPRGMGHIIDAVLKNQAHSA